MHDRHPGVRSPRSDPNADAFLKELTKVRPGTLFAKELTEWVVWYSQNKRRVSEENVRGMMQFHEKAIDGLFQLITLLAREVKPQLNDQPTRLWLPSGMRMTR